MYEANKIAVIGVPSSAGARQQGQEQAPQRLRGAGLVARLESRGYDVMDLGDLPEVTYQADTKNPKRQNLSLVLGVLGRVRESVDTALAEGAWPLVLGGDCSITIGVVAALRERFSELGLCYVDGDVDLNTPDTTPSGIIDGMVLAHLLGRGADDLRRFGSHCPLLEERQVSLFGYSVQAGGIDAVEIEMLATARMAKFPLQEIAADVKTAANRALSELEGKTAHFVVHFDVDVIDYDDFPAVDVPHRPGLALAQAQEALEVFVGSPKAMGLVVTEFNAARDGDGSLAQRLVDLIDEAAATRI